LFGDNTRITKIFNWKRIRFQPYFVKHPLLTKILKEMVVGDGRGPLKTIIIDDKGVSLEMTSNGG
jgi:hypothetical protein